VTLIYKIVPLPLWREAEAAGRFAGAPVDLADGYIHFSTASQAAETAAKHFRDQADLLLVAIEAESLGEALRWEPSRGGALFPHLYAELRLTAVRSVSPLPLGADGRHVFPPFPDEAPARFDPAASGWVQIGRDHGLIALVGPFWSKPDSDNRLYGMVAEARHLNRQNIMHGGMMMTFADHTMAMASAAASGGRTQATIQLDTQFIDAVREGDFLVGECRVVRQTRSLMFMAGTFTVGERTCAVSSGVWKLRGGSGAPD
jgi:uncharacterized protein (TIGR00369 family)